MLNQTTYSDLVRDLARRHVDIQHSAAKKRYLKVTVAADPMQKLAGLATFFQKTKATLPGDAFFVVQLSYDTLHEDSGSDQVLAHRRGGFMVMRKAKDTDESRDEVLAETERVAYELMAGVGDFFRGPAGRRAGRMLQRTGMVAEAVGPMGDSFYGTRFEFDFTESATEVLQFNPAKFLP